jgi:hypothetical protein
MKKKTAIPLLFIALMMVGFALAFLTHEGPAIPFIYTFF